MVEDVESEDGRDPILLSTSDDDVDGVVSLDCERLGFLDTGSATEGSSGNLRSEVSNVRSAKDGCATGVEGDAVLQGLSRNNEGIDGRVTVWDQGLVEVPGEYVDPDLRGDAGRSTDQALSSSLPFSSPPRSACGFDATESPLRFSATPP